MCTKPLTAWRGSDGKLSFSGKKAFHDVKTIDIPCGQCMECRLEKSRQWAMRITHESQLYEDNCFITLTYNDDNLPKNGSINKRDLQLFFKRLRKSIGDSRKIRYYAVGEYGDQTARPHYHAIIFNWWPEDARFHKMSASEKLYRSKELELLWPHGHSLFGTVTFDSAAYCARYTTKKVTGKNAEEHYQGREPEFSIMSRRPGIGFGWWQKYQSETLRDDNVYFKGKFVKPPLYYMTKLKEEDKDKYFSLKHKREKPEELDYDDFWYQKDAREKAISSRMEIFNFNKV